MDSKLILFVALLLMLSALIGLLVWHKREMHRKNSGIFKHLDNEQHLKDELKRARIEKETLMRVIKQLTINN